MIPLFFYIIIFQLTRSRGAWRNKEWVCCAGNYFNSHAHVERDQSRPKRQSHRLYFNSHAHVERDAYVLEKDKFDNISTHTLTWSVTCKEKGFTIWICHFNSHAHVERDTLGAVLSQSRQQFQLTRSRGAWPVGSSSVGSSSVISTHTLTWSVTP